MSYVNAFVAWWYAPYAILAGAIALVCLAVFVIGWGLAGDSATGRRLRDR
jgi:hypothetical protein